MYKLKNDLSLLIVTELFEQRNEQHYNLRNNSQFLPPIRTVHHGSESISFLGSKIWNILPNTMKNTNSIEAFQMQIKKWKPKKIVHVSSARLCSKCRFCLREFLENEKNERFYVWFLCLIYNFHIFNV